MTGVVKGVLARAAAAWGSEEEASAANRRRDSLGRNLMLGELTMARVGARVALAAEDVSQVARTSGTHTSRRETLSFVCFPITPFTVRLVLIRSNVSFAVEEVR